MLLNYYQLISYLQSKIWSLLSEAFLVEMTFPPGKDALILEESSLCQKKASRILQSGIVGYKPIAMADECPRYVRPILWAGFFEDKNVWKDWK